MVRISYSYDLSLSNGLLLPKPTEFEMRRRNEKFAKDVREGKKAVHASRADKLAHKPAVSAWTLGVIMFVVFGGGDFLSCSTWSKG